MEAPASSEPEKPGNASAALAVSRRGHCGDKNGDGVYDTENGDPSVNVGKDCALAEDSEDPGKQGKRCCCYTVPGKVIGLEAFSLGNTRTKCYKWSGQSIKAALADSKLEHEHKKGDIPAKDMAIVPPNERKDFAAIKKLVEDETWCPDIEKRFFDNKWCPDWHSLSFTAKQIHPIQATAGSCRDNLSTRDAATCIDQVHPADKKLFTAEELAAKVDRHYMEEAMCCCYPHSGIFGDSETCFHMYHEDIVYVQERLALLKDKKKDGGEEDEPEQREELGLELEDGQEEPKKGEEHLAKYKCPKAYWKESAEIYATGALEAGDAIWEYVGLKEQDDIPAMFSYICPTKEKVTKLRTCWERILYKIWGPVNSGPSHEEVLEPSNSAHSLLFGNRCDSEKTLQWQPRLCY